MAHGLSAEDAHLAAQAAQAAASPPAPAPLLPACTATAPVTEGGGGDDSECEEQAAAEGEAALLQSLGLAETAGPAAQDRHMVDLQQL